MNETINKKMLQELLELMEGVKGLKPAPEKDENERMLDEMMPIRKRLNLEPKKMREMA